MATEQKQPENNQPTTEMATEKKESDNQRRKEKGSLDTWNYKDVPKAPPPFLAKPKKILFGNRQYESFLNLMQKVSINISLFELFTNVPK